MPATINESKGVHGGHTIMATPLCGGLNFQSRRYTFLPSAVISEKQSIYRCIMQSNYDIFEEQSRTLFMRYNLETLAAKWNLRSDDTFVYILYFGEEYRIRKADSKVLPPAFNGTSKKSCSNNESRSMASLTIYDVLTYSDNPPSCSGHWESLSALGGIIGAGHEQKLTGTAGGNASFPPVEIMRNAITRIGGSFLSETSADLDAVVPVFPFLPMRFQYWEADDEFPASVKYLWDANALLFMHYETLWYAMSDFDRILLRSYSKRNK